MANFKARSFDHRVPRQIMEEELDRAKNLIAQHIRQNKQVASGRTINTMHVEVTEDEAILYGHKPFGVLETGRKAGRVPYAFSSIIYQWMQDKGLHATPKPYKREGVHKYTAQERADRSMASAIAHTIKTKGSYLHRKGGRDDVYSNVVPQTLERIRARLISLISGEVSHIIINSNKQ